VLEFLLGQDTLQLVGHDFDADDVVGLVLADQCLQERECRLLVPVLQQNEHLVFKPHRVTLLEWNWLVLHLLVEILLGLWRFFLMRFSHCDPFVLPFRKRHFGGDFLAQLPLWVFWKRNVTRDLPFNRFVVEFGLNELGFGLLYHILLIIVGSVWFHLDSLL